MAVSQGPSQAGQSTWRTLRPPPLCAQFLKGIEWVTFPSFSPWLWVRERHNVSSILQMRTQSYKVVKVTQPLSTNVTFEPKSFESWSSILWIACSCCSFDQVSFFIIWNTSLLKKCHAQLRILPDLSIFLIFLVMISKILLFFTGIKRPPLSGIIKAGIKPISSWALCPFKNIFLKKKKNASS